MLDLMDEVIEQVIGGGSSSEFVYLRPEQGDVFGLLWLLKDTF